MNKSLLFLRIALTFLCAFFGANAFAQVANYYTFSQSSGTYTPIIGGSLHASAVDNASYSFTLPFTFTYDGTDYTVARPSTNGFLVLGANAPAANQYTPLSTGATNFAISAFGANLNSTVRSEVLGTAPNRIYVCQWSNVGRYSSGLKVDGINFQIRLYETTNKIDIIYGTNTATATSTTAQVGLRGSAVIDYNNRLTTSNWASTTTGTANSSSCTYSSSILPASGRTFTWTPPLYRAQIISADPGSNIWCGGETRNVSVTIKNIGSAPWTDEGGKDFNVGVKWNTNGASWSDYNVRVDAKNLVPGATETYVFPITASANVGGTYGAPLVGPTNNLTFDLVYEGQFWFGNNNNGGGPGNTVFTTPVQTISTAPSATSASPAPANNATGVCYSGVGAISSISWGATTGATSYDVYFGAGSLPGSITANVATTTYSTGVLLANTTYYWKVVPRNACGITSGTPVTWSFTTSNAPCYCPSSGSTFQNGITGVTFNTINNLDTSVNTGYTDFTGLNTTVIKGSSYSLNIKVNTGGNYIDFQTAYIDWNGNGSFADAGENYSLGSATNVTNGNTSLSPLSITVPAGATTGTVRMRIQSQFNAASTNPCLTGFDGEVEDYQLKIIPATICVAPTTQPTGLNLTAVSVSQINGTFTAASPAPNSYLVVRSTSSIPPSAPVNGTTYTTGATLGAGYTVVDNDGNTTFSATGLTPNTTYYFYIYSFNLVCTGGPLYLESSPLTGNVFLPLSYCAASVSNGTQSAGTYIQKVRFLGTLNDVNNDQAAGNRYATVAPFGYQNYTTLPNKTRQAMGNGINVYVESNSILDVNGDETNDSYYRAWIDWNKDGDFVDAGEMVYESNAMVLSTTFGVIIPTNPSIIPYGPGDYRLRIRINKSESGFTSCNNINNNGETEDYLIQVIANCTAVITSVGKDEDQFHCGPGAVSLTATASGGGITEFRWYSAETGGTLVGTSAPATGGTTTTWNTPSINSTTTYYVEAYNGTCPSLVRIPVKANIKLVPAVSFTPSVAESCGKNSVITLSAVGGNEVDYLINENFEAGGLGTFSNVRTGPDYGTTINSRSSWQSLSSVNFPVNYGTGSSQTWFPALSSGVNGNKFVMASSDIGQISANNPRIAENALVSPQKSALEYVNLTLSFKMYYSRYHPDGTLTTKDFIDVQVATNAAGDNWVTVPAGNLIVDKGIGTRFEQLTFNLNSYAGQSTLKVRILYHGEWCDGVAVDDIQLYGEKKLKPSFSWDPGVNPLNFYTDAGATTLYAQGTPIEAVYIRPTLDQMESATSWNISATATLGNGCPVAGNITVTNSNKIWNSASSDWSDSSKWKPNAVLPTLNTCVIVRSPLLISSGNGLAKNISIQPGGSLIIKKDRTLTVTDYIKNETATLGNEDKLMLESDANLIQINSNAANSGKMTAQRAVTNLRYQPGTNVDYVYWSSPVAGQQTKGAGGFSPGTPNNRFFTYRESNDRFYETGDLTFTPGKGYAVQAESNQGAVFSKPYNFRGTPNNGDVNFNITRSANTISGGITYVHGYNLVGNPYPSNISFDQLHAANSGLIYKTIWFWTNGTYIPSQQGSTYSGNNYAVYNGTGGTAATVPANVIYSSVVPTGTVKVGQAFLVQKKVLGTDPLNFKNSYGPGLDLRVSTSGTFYSRGEATKDRFWLKLQSPDNLMNSQLIGYIAGATDGFEMDYDAEAFSLSSNLFYSLLGNQKLLIQGKGQTFTNEDKISLGANFYQNGIYTISLESAEGIFENNQNVYLKDKQAGILTNLNQGSYTFSATPGDTASRFEIVYKPDMVLAVQTNSKDELTVYREGNEFIVHAQNKKISNVEVFDVSGRLIYSANANSLKVIISAEKMVNSIYVLKINQGGQITTKKIKK
ncbi:GEVED domain-containing protein [Chryseobacterium sp. MP_3.2]|uniref:GEVED domain-containing protein n=1 Tax=Chryseobacterium sp. MP_3.2 TaxID=3071712 RepID=UPI002E01F6D0|nr:hypothetical protein [Chryseobacterium sp. MP_3.2]